MADELYDSIMKDIEPDLVTSNLRKLEEQYKDESAEEKTIRMLRYDAANEEFNERLDLHVAEIKESARTKRRNALKEKEIADQEREEKLLMNMENQFA
jgi:hypothetical protein